MAGSVWPALVAGARAKASEVEAKFDWVEGDIVPMSGGTRIDATYDLGSSSHRWRDAYFSRQLNLPAGSAGTPAITQQGTTNGFYFPTTSQIAASAPFLASNGGVSTPSLGFANSPTTGFYRAGADNIALAVAGTKVWEVTAAGEITKPLQPGFLATWNQTVTSIAIGSQVTLTSNWTEQLDVSSDFSTGVFQAPVTGKYLFAFSIKYDQGGLVIQTHSWNLFTTQRTYQCSGQIGPTGSISAGVPNSTMVGLSVIAPMTAGDRAYLFSYILGTTSSTMQMIGQEVGSPGPPFTNSAYTFFSGMLVA